jgi:UDP:flavonoid glycosyltransferase YjiC (YdhE family)
VLFTHGSANVQAARFFATSGEAARALGRRALLVTPRREDAPASLPPGARHESFVPFTSVLPRCAALVSHGGAGTVAQGLRAGLPQLAVPLAYDQHDNGSRLADLGVGAWVDARRYTARRAAGMLRRLLDDAGCAERARDCAARVAAEDGATRAADEIEGLRGR